MDGPVIDADRLLRESVALDRLVDGLTGPLVAFFEACGVDDPPEVVRSVARLELLEAVDSIALMLLTAKRLAS